MLKPQNFSERFADVAKLAPDLYRMKDAVPAFTYYYYVKLATNPGDKDLLAVSENGYDDDFATHILASAGSVGVADGLDVRHLGPYPQYRFDALLTVPPHYHSYFKGRLDAERKNLFFCCPIYRCEFAGNETSEEFYSLRREIVPTLNWNREPAPKIVLRFDNPKTGGGTVKRRRIFAKLDLLLQEIDKLNGVQDGFIEIGNYRGAIAEIRSPESNAYRLAVNGESEQALNAERLKSKVYDFLTSP